MTSVGGEKCGPADTLFAGEGEIRALCRSMSWGATALGPVDRWPQSLRLAVKMCLDARFPMSVWAGPELALVYNEAYSPVLGPAKHPWALGRPAREVWSELWGRLRPEVETVIQRGDSTVHEDERFPLRRGGVEEESFFTYSFTPIQEADGRIVGALNVLLETTDRVRCLSEREARYRALVEGASDAIIVTDPAGAGHVLSANPAACALFGYGEEEFRGVDRASILDATEPELVRLLSERDGQGRASATLTCRRRDGSRFSGELRTALFADARGKILAVEIIRDISEQVRMRQATELSEKRYRTLFESIDEGFCIVQMIFDEAGRPIDQRFIEANPAFERQTGIRPVLGRTVRELMPKLEPFWFEVLGNVALTGEGRRYENYVESMGRWFDIYAFRVGEPRQRSVAVLFNDITDRKRRELNAAFLADIGEDLARLRSTEDILQTVGAKLGAHLGIKSCQYCELDEAYGELTFRYGWREPNQPKLCSTCCIMLSRSPEYRRASAAGETTIVANTQTDERCDATSHAAENIRSFVTVPFRIKGQLKSLLSFNDSRPHRWMKDEVELLQEVANRVFPRIERARVEEALRESEERYRSLFESMDEGFCIIQVLFEGGAEGETPVDYRFLQANPTFEKQTGLRDAAGPLVRELLPEHEERWLQVYGRVARTGESVRFQHPAQSIGRYFDVYAFRFGPAHSRQVAVLFNDVTHRKRAEDALRESQARLEQERVRLQAILDTMPVGLITAEVGGRLTAANDELKRIYRGWVPLEEIGDYSKYIGRWPETGERLKPDDWPVAQALLHGRKTKGLVVDIQRFDGTKGTVMISAAPIQGERGETIGAVGAIQDITELREAQARLEEADRRKNHFLAVLSHELRNPLTPVKNSLYILERAAPGGDQARRAKDVIERQIDQLSHLVDDLLDVTRIARGKIQLQRRRLELNELVRRTLEDHRTLFENSGLDVRLEPAPQQVFIDADWNRVAQILSNLLQNAAKFTPRAGRVTVEVSTDSRARQALLRVADTGAGMGPEVLARLFEPFMQADTTLDRSKGGLGLGLALVKGLVEQHGGSVEARSEGTGRGSEFIARLPLDLSGWPPSERHRAACAKVRRRVLVIEDNVDAADSLRELLVLDGHDVAVAYDGVEGIARAREFGPDVVLCDIGLPGMDGYAVARALRAEEGSRQAHLVAVSGYALPEDLQRAAEAGFERHLAKPPSVEKLEGVLGGVPLQ